MSGDSETERAPSIVATRLDPAPKVRVVSGDVVPQVSPPAEGPSGVAPRCWRRPSQSSCP